MFALRAPSRLVRLYAASAALAPATLLLFGGCDLLDREKLIEQGQRTLEESEQAVAEGVVEGQAAVEEGTAQASEELERELSASGLDYPDSPQGVFASARQASAEGKWPLYLTYLTSSSVEKMARNFIQAAATDRPPRGVTAGPDFAKRVEIIKAVLDEQGISAAEVDAANADTAAHSTILGYFASPSFFVADVMQRTEPEGFAELPPVESVQWQTDGDLAAATFSGPGGQQGIVTLKKVDGLWKIDM
ncbi:MAG TPA: hypothetical protein VGN57_09070 [Pirellulaceae bacterium]|jgi:hypothetical protein|nr:hypothetical protein [Pirellulaceae bacterium]